MQTQLLFMLLIATMSFGQEVDFDRHIIGSRFSGYLLHTSEHASQGPSKTYELRFEPYYLFALDSNIHIGVMGEYHTAGSTLDDVDIPDDLYGIGVMGRFDYTLPPFIKNEYFRERFTCFSECSFSATNFFQAHDKSFQRSEENKWEYWLLRMRLLGVSYDIFRGFSADISGMVYKFFPGRWGVLPNVGLSFKF